MSFNILTAIAACFVSAGFAILYNAPSKTILASGIAGMTGWVVYAAFSSERGLDLFFAAGAAAFTSTILSQFFARKFKMPVIVFSIPGLIPLVPGGAAFNMMRSLIEERYTAAIQFGTETFFISGAIALGISLSSAVFQLLQPYLLKKDLEKRSRK